MGYYSGRVHSCGEEYVPENLEFDDICGTRTKPKKMNRAEIKKETEKFVESVIGITETD